MRSVFDLTVRSFNLVLGRKEGNKRSISRLRNLASHCASNRRPQQSIGPTSVILGNTRVQIREYTKGRQEMSEEEFRGVSHLNSDFAELFNYASSLGPSFPVDPNSIHVLTLPSDFYNSLLLGIRSAKRRIVISSLYLGAEPMAEALVVELDKALGERPELEVEILLDCLRGSRNVLGPKTAHMKLNEADYVGLVGGIGGSGPSKSPISTSLKNLKVGDVGASSSDNAQSGVGSNVNEECELKEGEYRGRDGGVREKKKFGYYDTVSSVSMLFPLEWKYGDRVKVSYYHTPKLHGMWKAVLPERVNELVGVQHSKFYLFDNDLLISGANLSEQYFTNRQDRYIWIRQNPKLAQFYQSFLQTIARFSFSLHPTTGILAFPNDLPDPSKNPSLFNAMAKDAFSSLLSSHMPPHPLLPASQLLHSSSTWVFPTIQLGHAGVRHDEAITLKLLSHIPSPLNRHQLPHHPNSNKNVDSTNNLTTEPFLESAIQDMQDDDSPLSSSYSTHLTSPYFNITESYNQAILSTKKPLRVIVASPGANGFHNASGLSSYIPWAYDSLLKDWIASLDVKRLVEVREWAKEGWTFHAKGIWIDSLPSLHSAPNPSSIIASPSYSSPSPITFNQNTQLLDSNLATHIETPPMASSSIDSSLSLPPQERKSYPEDHTGRFAITMVGSSNFGTRSTERDLESQLAIFTLDEGLADRLKEEREKIWGEGEEVSQNTFVDRSHNHSPLLRILMPFATKYM